MKNRESVATTNVNMNSLVDICVMIGSTVNFLSANQIAANCRIEKDAKCNKNPYHIY